MSFQYSDLHLVICISQSVFYILTAQFWVITFFMPNDSELWPLCTTCCDLLRPR